MLSIIAPPPVEDRPRRFVLSEEADEAASLEEAVVEEVLLLPVC